MAEEPGKCRYIMGILEKNKKSKGTAFVYDENNDYYKMEINGIEFVCDSIHSDYEKHAVELAQAYEEKAAGYRGLSYAGYKGDVWNYKSRCNSKLTRKAEYRFG